MNPHFVEKNVANLIIYPSTAVRDLKVWLDVYAYDYIKQQANERNQIDNIIRANDENLSRLVQKAQIHQVQNSRKNDDV